MDLLTRLHQTVHCLFISVLLRFPQEGFYLGLVLLRLRVELPVLLLERFSAAANSSVIFVVHEIFQWYLIGAKFLALTFVDYWNPSSLEIAFLFLDLLQGLNSKGL